MQSADIVIGDALIDPGILDRASRRTMGSGGRRCHRLAGYGMPCRYPGRLWGREIPADGAHDIPKATARIARASCSGRHVLDG
ncbi:hypothetical protein [Acidiferrobacter thiooxydans]|uniref:hypothetical protein n=1 Tax=Acidiferrobacter thiooxydans TaxID=163359 RepID=UPI0011C01A26|nr:hypothetical protein [Acidiferrobacter thiooxydans]